MGLVQVRSLSLNTDLNTLTAGTYGNVLRFLPPLVIGDELLHEGLDIIDAAFASSV